MPQYYKKEITPRDRAHVAMLMKNAENKDHNARNHVESRKKDFGDGISALCVIYNATGDALKFITTHDYHGHIYADPYPTIIQNGQWAAFLHVKPSVITAGSSAGVVYRGKNQSGEQHDWMLAWSIPYVGDNHVSKTFTDLSSHSWHCFLPRGFSPILLAIHLFMEYGFPGECCHDGSCRYFESFFVLSLLCILFIKDKKKKKK
ncbi:hypothetical protein CsSME_00014708 [Camellia sinensis var. sinensis]